MHNEIRDQFFPQKTRISEDPTSMPEYTDVVEAWDMVTSLLNSDIPVLDSKEDSLVARMAKRLCLKKDLIIGTRLPILVSCFLEHWKETSESMTTRLGL